MFEFWLFTTDGNLASKCVDAGITGIVIDWEYMGKDQRQRGAALECNHDSLQDLVRMREIVTANIICRINPLGPHTAEEIETAIIGGADVLILPMVRDPGEVETFLSYIKDRSEAGILVETKEAMYHAPALADLPLDYVYVGLNDLAISRGSPNLFHAILDGTVERMRNIFGDIKFGFGGITVLDRGFPIPFHLLLREMVTLGCDFGFLRRSFRQDIIGRDIPNEIDRISRAILEYQQRTMAEIEKDKQELFRIIESVPCEVV